MPEDAKEVAEIEQQLRGRAHTAAIAALEVVPFAMLIADGDGEVLAVNGKWMELSGLGRANSLGPGWLNVLEPDTRHRLREEVQRIAQEGGGATVDHQIGTYPHKRWARWWISRHDLDGLALVAIGVADVDEDYTRQANLYHLATHDSLTGLINRSHFIECIDQALRRSQRQARHVAVVYVDLDGFKRVNDQGGHSLGDRVLFAIASRLRHVLGQALPPPAHRGRHRGGSGGRRGPGHRGAADRGRRLRVPAPAPGRSGGCGRRRGRALRPPRR